MTKNKSFWIALMIGLLVLYAVALGFVISGQYERRQVWVAALILGAHLFEIPLAFSMLKGRQASPLRVILLTQLFGLVWWVPARRGLFAVN